MMPFAARRLVCLTLFSLLFLSVPDSGRAQQLLGGITGTVSDSTGGVVPDAEVKIHNSATGLSRATKTNGSGAYQLFDVPPGTYSVTFTKGNFKTGVHSEVLVQANRTTTVDEVLQPGAVSTTVTVTGTPLLNKSDTTNGYVLGPAVIEEIPLGTGSFTQLATLSPGVSADLLAGSDTNAGLGNQAIWANGQRDTSNSFLQRDQCEQRFQRKIGQFGGIEPFRVEHGREFSGRRIHSNQHLRLRRHRPGTAHSASRDD